MDQKYGHGYDIPSRQPVAEDSSDEDEEEEDEEEEEEEESPVRQPAPPKRGRPRGSLLTGRGVTMKMLIDEQILEAGEKLLSINYLGKKFIGDLMSDGRIKWIENGQVFSSPSSWAMHCKKLINPEKKSGCGWASVRYKGKKLDQYKSTWFRKQRLGNSPNTLGGIGPKGLIRPPITSPNFMKSPPSIEASPLSRSPKPPPVKGSDSEAYSPRDTERHIPGHMDRGSNSVHNAFYADRSIGISEATKPLMPAKKPVGRPPGSKSKPKASPLNSLEDLRASHPISSSPSVPSPKHRKSPSQGVKSPTSFPFSENMSPSMPHHYDTDIHVKTKGSPLPSPKGLSRVKSPTEAHHMSSGMHPRTPQSSVKKGRGGVHATPDFRSTGHVISFSEALQMVQSQQSRNKADKAGKGASTASRGHSDGYDESFKTPGAIPHGDQRVVKRRPGRPPKDPNKLTALGLTPPPTPASSILSHGVSAYSAPRGRGRRPVRTRISHKHAAVNNSSDPRTLIECAQFSSTGKIQPFSVTISTSCLLLIDFHCHLSNTEVTGYLAGKWDSHRQHLRVLQSYPCKCSLSERQESSTVEEQIQHNIQSQGLVLVGWYHSHPFYQPDPSVQDIKNQFTYQQVLKDENENEPCIGVIVSPYDSYKKEALFKAFWVQSLSSNHGDRLPLPLVMSFTTQQDQQLTQDIINEMVSLVNFYRDTADCIKFTDTWLPDSTYLEKIKYSVIRKFPQDQTDGRFLDFIQKILIAAS